MFLKKFHATGIGILILLGILASFTIYRLQVRYSIPHTRTGEIRRIISITPSLTECLYAIGCGDRIVGVGDFSTYPGEVKTKPRVGGYINPNFEVILTLQPDLIVIQGKNEKMAEFCSFNGIRFERYALDSIDDIYATIRSLGNLLHVRNRADSLCHALKEGLDEVSRRVSGIPGYTVFFSLGHTPGNINTLFTIGRPSFISELITIAGGKNSFDDNDMLYPEISKETLVMRAPDIILESISAKHNSPEYKERLMKDWQKFPTIPAVKNNKIYLIEEEYIEIPGPRVVMAARLLGSIIHPEAFR